MTVEHIAQVAHELNKAYCESIGDMSQSSWEDAPQWQKTSAINGVKFHIGHPEATPSASHESWLAEKAADGWKYGEVKNAELKEHPCFLPYEELPVSQRSKDFIFRQTVHSLAGFLEPSEYGISTPTFGQKAVGYKFNPSGSSAVDDCKKSFAQAIDLMQELSMNSDSPEQKRLASVAITEAQGAQMWGVKAITWQD